MRIDLRDGGALGAQRARASMGKTVLVYDCPRCDSAKMTFDVLRTIPTVLRYDWQRWYEAFSVCRNCDRSTVFVISQLKYDDRAILDKHPPTAVEGSLNQYFKVEGYICLKDMGAQQPPDHVPDEIANAFHESAVSLRTECWNAAGTMF